MTSNIESEINENASLNSNQMSAVEQLSQIIDSNNLLTTNEDKSLDKSLSTTAARTPGQTAIGAKLIEKLEKLAADSKENKKVNDKISSVTNDDDSSSSNKNNDSGKHPSRHEVAQNLMKTLSDADPQKNVLLLATKLAELQEQNRLTLAKINESDKRSIGLSRERDQILLENSRTSAAKTKLESLCRELHKHNQQIRDESTRKQQDDETKRQELAKKFQTTIDEITSQLSNYSTQSASLRERNLQLSEQLASVVKDYELRETEYEAVLKKKKIELRLAEGSLEKSHLLLNEQTELIKQERQVSEADRAVLYKKCEELTISELSLRSQLTIYVERHQEFENAIQQSNQMVTSCHKEIERMGNKVKSLEQEKNDFRQRWDTTEQNQRKSNEDMKLLEKEKRQLDIKVDKLDRLCRNLQQERLDLKAKVKDLTKSSTNIPIVTGIENSAPDSVTDKIVASDVLKSSETSINVHD
ncbi:unnamed protein product [Rotaria socialis]|uniref:Alpha-taxilin n=1 Tax=Rotaria socialis TaxID=392032 RepID=A0A818Q3W9_9BILA|nr:unnamed protein product [Rotaria socialis]CAF3462010.1 unnamed protein product [Rotaria socialis]CAF3533820.1 unnamed protein product [Rotaria socialis]CAF3633406.1 unnamed protein product [Rotaria socialis]CAF3699349.1 unnamed protein product [Rotaria socialis]